MSGYVWQRWMVTDFRAAGLVVHEVENWENRGRPASSGAFTPNGAQTKHHTGVRSSAANPHPTLRTLIVGRPDLPGPLCQWSTGADGSVYVIAAGRANHAGRIGKSGVPGMPYGADGNALALGDEVDTDGTQALPAAQRRAVAIASRVCLERFELEAAYIHRHADISPTGKWDLGSLTTQQLRDDADAAPTNQEDLDIMDKATQQYLDRKFAELAEGQKRGRQQAATVKALVKAVAKGLGVLAETVATGDQQIKARITKSKQEIQAAIEAADAADPDQE